MTTAPVPEGLQNDRLIRLEDEPINSQLQSCKSIAPAFQAVTVFFEVVSSAFVYKTETL